MKVKLRHIDQSFGKDFDTIPFHKLEELIELIRKTGGVTFDGDTHEFHSYQIILDEDAAYAEILIGADDEPTTTAP